MKRFDDPVGPDNQDWFDQTLSNSGAGPIVCAWGAHGNHRDQDLAVRRWLERHPFKLLALGITRDRHPRHPLYLPYGTRLIPFSGRGDPSAGS
jgi:hypothetical protein